VPAHDNLADALLLMPGTTSVTMSNVGATTEPGELVDHGDGLGPVAAVARTVWVRWPMDAAHGHGDFTVSAGFSARLCGVLGEASTGNPDPVPPYTFADISMPYAPFTGTCHTPWSDSADPNWLYPEAVFQLGCPPDAPLEGDITFTYPAPAAAATLPFATMTGVGSLTADLIVPSEPVSITATMTGVGSLTPYARAPSTVDPSTGREPYRLIVVDMWGNRYAELSRATIGTVIWTLNAAGSLRFTLGADDPQVPLCRPIVREVQLWRGAQMLDWFVLLKPRKPIGSKVYEYQCPTVDWHLGKRVIAAPPAFVELLDNPDFEFGGRSWVPGFDAGSSLPTHPYHQWQTDRVETGRWAVRLGGVPMILGGDPVAAAGHRQYLAQTIIYANPEHAKEEVPIKLSARCFVEWFASKSYDGWGLHLEAFHPATGASIGYAYSSIDEKTRALLRRRSGVRDPRFGGLVAIAGVRQVAAEHRCRLSTHRSDHYPHLSHGAAPEGGGRAARVFHGRQWCGVGHGVHPHDPHGDDLRPPQGPRH
jgi:hypothetical protein